MKDLCLCVCVHILQSAHQPFRSSSVFAMMMSSPGLPINNIKDTRRSALVASVICLCLLAILGVTLLSQRIPLFLDSRQPGIMVIWYILYHLPDPYVHTRKCVARLTQFEFEWKSPVSRHSVSSSSTSYERSFVRSFLSWQRGEIERVRRIRPFQCIDQAVIWIPNAGIGNRASAYTTAVHFAALTSRIVLIDWKVLNFLYNRSNCTFHSRPTGPFRVSDSIQPHTNGFFPFYRMRNSFNGEMFKTCCVRRRWPHKSYP